MEIGSVFKNLAQQIQSILLSVSRNQKQASASKLVSRMKINIWAEREEIMNIRRRYFINRIINVSCLNISENMVPSYHWYMWTILMISFSLKF